MSLRPSVDQIRRSASETGLMERILCGVPTAALTAAAITATSSVSIPVGIGESGPVDVAIFLGEELTAVLKQIPVSQIKPRNPIKATMTTAKPTP